MDKLTCKTLYEIEKEMARVGFINDSDDTDRLFDVIIDDLIPIDVDERKNLELKDLIEGYMNDNYKIIREIDKENNYHGYYYDTQKEYKSISEFKRDYKIK